MLVVAVNNSLSGKFEDLLSKMLESLYSKKAVEKKGARRLRKNRE
jgi:hypothetical protein